MEYGNIIFEVLTTDNENKLLKELDYISLEDGFIKTISTPFINAFKHTSESIVKSKSSLLSLLENRGTLSLIKDVNSRRVNAMKLSKNVNYRIIDGIKVRTIVGMQVRLLNVVTMNKECLTYINNNFDKQIDEIDTRLAKFIGNPEVRKSFRLPSNNLTDIDNFTKDIKKQLGDYFDPKDIRDVVELKNIIGNNDEYANVFSTLKEINGIVTDKFLMKVKKKTNKITERIDVIYEILEARDLEVSKETLTGLINGIDILSNYVTIISGIYYSHMKSMEVALGIHKVYKKFKDKK